MDCRQFELAWVSDDHDERQAAQRHAAGCPRCTETVLEDRELLEAVVTWKESASGPNDNLGRRIAAALAEEGLIESDSARTTRRSNRETPRCFSTTAID